MVLMTDSTGTTFIYSEDYALRMARQQSLRVNVLDIHHALRILNANNRRETYELDSDFMRKAAFK